MVQHIDTAVVPAPEVVAAELGVSVGHDVLRRHRVFTARGLVVQIADSYYPMDVADRVPALREEDTGPGRSYTRIRDAGIPLDHFVERIKIQKPTAAHARDLGLTTREARVARLTRVAFSDERPVEFFDSVMPSDAYIFEYRFEAADQRLLPDEQSQ